VQPSGDHQVQHKPQAIVEAEGDAFADAAQLAHGMAFNGRHRRLRSAEEKGARDPNLLERLTDDALFKRVNISGDVWQLRHGYQIAWDVLDFAMFSWIRSKIAIPESLNRSI
jgi:hypothetical protein